MALHSIRNIKRRAVRHMNPAYIFGRSGRGQSYFVVLDKSGADWASAKADPKLAAVCDEVLNSQMMLNTMNAEAQHMAEYLAVEAAKVEYVCTKVKDGTVVDTFDTREDALALVLKHAKQRKAKLQVMNSLTGEFVLFTEEEMAG